MSDLVTNEEKDIIVEARKKTGLTQQQVADRSGIAIRHYQMFESGQRKLTTASFDTATRVLKALELDIATYARGDYFNE